MSPEITGILFIIGLGLGIGILWLICKFAEPLIDILYVVWKKYLDKKFEK